jgi:ubiquinone/menaquinone biosynthesis C-methylase UbiE
MAIDFRSEHNRYSYAGRIADAGWAKAITAIVDPVGRTVVDVGCGGGIYSAAWDNLGAKQVIGVDSSEQMIAAAVEGNAASLSFRLGSAEHTGLPDHSADLVFIRAVIHHLPDIDACFREAFRLLSPAGLVIVQDRTPEDVALPGSPEHPRGYFFECFPRLLAVEAGRRPTAAAVEASLRRVGFDDVENARLWEIRKRHVDGTALCAELRARTGRSILHELDDGELEALVSFVAAHLPAEGPVVERDRWTLWWGRRPGV